jgi:hypothetical protein
MSTLLFSRRFFHFIQTGMPPRPNTAEVELDPVEMGESAIESRPEPSETEPNEAESQSEKIEISEPTGKVTDEEIESGAIFQKLATHSGQERGGFDGEVKVNTQYESRNVGHFTPEGVRMNTETGLVAMDEMMGFYKDKKTEEEMVEIVAKFKEIDRLLLESPNTFIRINDYVDLVEGKEVLKVGYAIMDSQGRISYPSVEHFPKEQIFDDDDEAVGYAGEGEDAQEVFSLGEVNDNATELDILPTLAATESMEVEIETEIEESILSSADTEKEISEPLQADIFSEPKKDLVSLVTKTESAESITAKLAEEFGFTYGVEKNNAPEFFEVQPEAVSIAEPIKIIFLDEVEKSIVVVNENGLQEEAPILFDGVARINEIKIQESTETPIAIEVVTNSLGTQEEIASNLMPVEQFATQIREFILPEVVAENNPSVEVSKQQEEVISIIKATTSETISLVKTMEINADAKPSQVKASEETIAFKTEIKAPVEIKENEEVKNISRTVSAETGSKIEQLNVAILEARQIPVSGQEQGVENYTSVETVRKIEADQGENVVIGSVSRNILPGVNLLDQFIVGSRSASFAQYAEAVNENTKNVEVLEDKGITMHRQLRAA